MMVAITGPETGFMLILALYRYSKCSNCALLYHHSKHRITFQEVVYIILSCNIFIFFT